MWITFSAHTPGKVKYFKRGIRKSLVIQEVSSVQHDFVLSLSFVSFHNYWTRDDDIALGSFDSGRIVTENNI